MRSQAGAELVEFALVLPILLLVFGGIVDFGLLLQRQQVITNAAREGARLAVLPGYAIADVDGRGRRSSSSERPQQPDQRGAGGHERGDATRRPRDRPSGGKRVAGHACQTVS